MFCVFVVEREERKRQRKKDTWNFWFWVVLVQKWRFRDANLFSENGLLKPLFYNVLGGRAFWTKLSRKGNFGPPPKIENFG